MHRVRPDLVLSERYRLTRHIASGGMGQVWEAFDQTLQRRVAVKVMHPHTQHEIQLAERFREEARFAAQLTHGNIVTVHDFGEYDELAYLVMEIVDGPTLAQLLADGALEADLVRQVLWQLATALEAAHAVGIIHRDIKPANVIMDLDGQTKLMDFGIARSVDGQQALTSTGQVLGTADYLSPEQAMGHSVGPATDIYALGVLAHEMLSGSKPFDRGAPIATALAHVQDPPPPLPDGTPDDLAAAIADCLAKEPGDRPTATELAQRLQVVPEAEVPETVESGQPIYAPHTGAGHPPPRRAIVEP